MKKPTELVRRLCGSEAVRYLFAGAATTAVNYAVSFLLHYAFSLEEAPSNITGIVVSVVFAYIVNKLLVFRSHVSGAAGLLREALVFFASRVLTMLLEAAGVPLLELVVENFAIRKIAVNILVIILNYIFGKLLVFRTGGRKSNKGGLPSQSENGKEAVNE